MMKMKHQSSEWNKERIYKLRKYLAITQTEMAKNMGTRQQTISEWELGLYRPRGMSVTLLNIIAEKSSFKYKTKKNR